MKGITEKINDNYSIFYIESLTDELKLKIKSELVALCHGEAHRDSPFSIHSISTTISQLLQRYPAEENKQKGFIGEILLNIVIREYYDNFEVASPFFNKEEAGSAKKGFDIILFNKSDKSVWITESKAGSVSNKNPQTVDEKITERITTAERDLNTRLNEDNQTIWLNAFNDVSISMNESDEKEVVKSIIGLGSTSSTKSCVILGGIAFHDIKEKFHEDTILRKKDRVISSKKFSKVKLIAIQKNTYKKVTEYLEEVGATS